LELGGFFDRAGGVFGDSFLDADLVHGADFADEGAEGARGCSWHFIRIMGKS
jgi:hypothetical protein